MLEYTEEEFEIMTMTKFLLEAANQIPDVFLLMSDTILPRISLILSNSTNPKVVSIIKAILMKISSREGGDKKQMDGTSPKAGGGHKRVLPSGGPTHSSALSDLGFVGLLEAGNFTGSKTRKSKNAKLCQDIVGAFCLHG
jgi:hypothetical protein